MKREHPKYKYASEGVAYFSDDTKMDLADVEITESDETRYKRNMERTIEEYLEKNVSVVYMAYSTDPNGMGTREGMDSQMVIGIFKILSGVPEVKIADIATKMMALSEIAETLIADVKAGKDNYGAIEDFAVLDVSTL